MFPVRRSAHGAVVAAECAREVDAVEEEISCSSWHYGIGTTHNAITKLRLRSPGSRHHDGCVLFLMPTMEVIAPAEEADGDIVDYWVSESVNEGEERERRRGV